MGNCGSSLDCTECLKALAGRSGPYYRPKGGLGSTEGSVEGCPTKTGVNADIAGIGILVSFYFSAGAVFVVVIWGYLTATLPSGLLQSADKHALLMLKSPFRRHRHHKTSEALTLIQTPKQQSRSHVLVKFIKMLSDQQLITGLAILIAALSSRCVISQEEWHIVTSLAYFSATTHSLSLDVLRNYLVQHTWVRYFRVTFTLVFLILFTFTYLADHLTFYIWARYTYLKSNWIVQCALQAWVSDRAGLIPEEVGLYIVPILIIIWGKHISAITRLAAPKKPYNRHATTMIMDYIATFIWSWTKRLPRLECAEVVADARLYYDNKIKPSDDQAEVSAWYFLEQYHEAYLSEIPVWAFQFVYGTTKTIEAVRTTNVYLSKEDWMLGFGQVVAIGLLVLPLLALADMVNEKNVLDDIQSSRPQDSPRIMTTADTSALSQAASVTLVQSVYYAQSGSVSQYARVEDPIPPGVGRKVAIRCLIFCAIATTIMVTAGSLYGQQALVLLGAVPAWFVLKLTIACRRQVHQARYILTELKLRKTRKASSQSPSTVHSTSGDSTSHIPPRLPSLDISENLPRNAHTTATETSPTFGRPRRQDTEASLGLTTLFNRQDGSS